MPLAQCPLCEALLGLLPFPTPIRVIDASDANAATETLRDQALRTAILVGVTAEHPTWASAYQHGWRTAGPPRDGVGILTRDAQP